MTSRIRVFTAAAVVACALTAPAAAHAEPTISIEGDKIVFTGDDASTQLWVERIQNGEQVFYSRGEVHRGPGCRVLDNQGNTDPNFTTGYISCPLAGITGFVANAGAGDDRVDFMGTNVMTIPTFVDMGPGNDHWDLGSSGPDTATGGEGDDKLLNGLGDDVLRGGPGDDVVYGGDFSPDRDQLFGEEGNDNLDAQSGDDLIDGGPGDDILQNGNGDDVQEGGDGNDFVVGGAGNDTSRGGEGNDRVGAHYSTSPELKCDEPGDDIVDGGGGDDLVCGGAGSDDISGGAGADRVGAVDSARDAAVSCGDGVDVLSADLVDPVAADCERQAQADAVAVASSGVTNVPVPCPPAGCAGTLSLAESRNADTPAANAFPDRPATASKKVLARSKFKLKRGATRLRLRLPAKVAKQLRSRGKTSIEARIQTTVGGRKVTIRRTFPVAKR